MADEEMDGGSTHKKESGQDMSDHEVAEAINPRGTPESAPLPASDAESMAQPSPDPAVTTPVVPGAAREGADLPDVNLHPSPPVLPEGAEPPLTPDGEYKADAEYQPPALEIGETVYYRSPSHSEEERYFPAIVTGVSDKGHSLFVMTDHTSISLRDVKMHKSEFGTFRRAYPGDDDDYYPLFGSGPNEAQG